MALSVVDQTNRIRIKESVIGKIILYVTLTLTLTIHIHEVFSLTSHSSLTINELIVVILNVT